MNQKEVWKDVKNYEGIYQISSIGRIKSLDRVITRSNGSTLTIRGKLLTTRLCIAGYDSVGLRKPREKKVYKRIHQLVAESFLNHNSCGHKIVVDHIDNNKSNNKLSNLQVISHRQNSSKDRINCSSKYTGVHWDKNNNKWISTIRINGEKKYLGSFDNELEASLTYRSKLHELLNNQK